MSLAAELERALHYPLGDQLPPPGRATELRPGVKWLRMQLPFALDHINLWLLRDRFQGREGWTVVDTCIDRAESRADWEKVFDGLDLIAIGPDGIGEGQPLAKRVGLCLDAAHNAQRRYTIDPERVYVGGFSDGARVASLLAVNYPELFRGGLYLGGMHWYRDVPVLGEDRRMWRGELPTPNDERLTLVRERTRHAFVCGEKDPVLPQVEAVYRLASASGFKHLLWLPIRGMAHNTPKRKYMTQAFEFLDAGAPEPPPGK